MRSGIAGRVFTCAIVLVACLFLSLAAMAQSTVSGAIGGIVMDQQKAVVPGAQVTVKNLGTNREDSAESDAAGRFRVGNLQPGTYSLSITAGSFAPYKQQGVVVEVGRITEIEAALGVAGKGEVVEVTGEAPAIQTEQHDFTANINQTSINELPINGRRWSQYALLTPDRKSTRLNSSHIQKSRMPSSA